MGPSSAELGPLAQALQRSRSAAAYPEQQPYVTSKYVAAPLPPANSNRKPLTDYNFAPKRPACPKATVEQRPSIPGASRDIKVGNEMRKYAGVNRQWTSDCGSEQRPTNCDSGKRSIAAGTEQQHLGVRALEHHEYIGHATLGQRVVPAAGEAGATGSGCERQLIGARFDLPATVSDQEMRPCAPRAPQERTSATGAGPQVSAGLDLRATGNTSEQHPNMAGFEPRQLAAEGAHGRSDALGNPDKQLDETTNFELRPNAGPGFEMRASMFGFQPRPPAATATEQYLGGFAAAVGSHFTARTNAGTQSRMATGLDQPNANAPVAPLPAKCTTAGPDPKRTAEHPMHLDSSVNHPAKSAVNGLPPQPHQRQQHHLLDPAHLRQASFSNLQRPSLGPLTAAAATFVNHHPHNNSQRRPIAAEEPNLQRSSTAAFSRPPTGATTAAKAFSTATGRSGAAVLAGGGGWSSAKSISWMDICAEGRAEADRKRGLSLPPNDRSELKQWLYDDIMQRQSHPLHNQKPIVFS